MQISDRYPTDYYRLRRRVTAEIREQLAIWSARPAEKALDVQEVRTWAHDLSLRSGIPNRGIVKLFSQLSPATTAWFLKEGDL